MQKYHACSRVPASVGLALLTLLPRSLLAVDGISVTAHWSGSNENLYGGYGDIVRHNIQDSQVVGHQTLYSGGNARNPVISPDGSRVAFIRSDGRILVMGIDGSSPTELANSAITGKACLDFPHNQWVYYNGGTLGEDGSKIMRRVNADTNVDEQIAHFKKDNGTTDCQTWRIHVAHDLVRAAVRTDDLDLLPHGAIVAYDIASDNGRLRQTRAVGEKPSYRCSTGMDPLGVYFIEGHQNHRGITIHRWDNLANEYTISDWQDTGPWDVRWDDGRSASENWAEVDTGEHTYTGQLHNRNGWSTNSQDWVCIHIGWDERGRTGANQMLIDWQNHERIVVTSNTRNSYDFDCAGDFWVGTTTAQPPAITLQPQSQTVGIGDPVTFVVAASGSPPLTYQWLRNGSSVPTATGSSYTFDAAFEDNGALYSCRVTNSVDSVDSDAATLTVQGDTVAPTLISASAADDPTRVTVLFSEPLAQASAESAGNYAVDHGVSVSAAALQGDQTTVVLTTSAMTADTTYTLTVNNVADQATPANPIATDSTVGFTYTEGGPTNQPPTVTLGATFSVDVDNILPLGATVNDDGLPGGPLTVAWSKQSGPGQVSFDPASAATTAAVFDTVGSYTIRVEASDGDLSAHADADVEVLPTPTITITSPVGGEQWQAGTSHAITWDVVRVDDVRIDVSYNGGATWQPITQTVSEGQTGWRSYGWTVPNLPTSAAIIQLTEYSMTAQTQSGTFVIIGDADAGTPDIVPADVSVPPADSGSGDRANPGADGATPGADGATPGADGATPGADGATPGADGATPGTDGASTGDRTRRIEVAEGCACSSRSTGIGWGLLAGLLLLRARSRRSTAGGGGR